MGAAVGDEEVLHALLQRVAGRRTPDDYRHVRQGVSPPPGRYATPGRSIAARGMRPGWAPQILCASKASKRQTTPIPVVHQPLQNRTERLSTFFLDLSTIARRALHSARTSAPGASRHLIHPATQSRDAKHQPSWCRARRNTPRNRPGTTETKPGAQPSNCGSFGGAGGRKWRSSRARTAKRATMGA